MLEKTPSREYTTDEVIEKFLVHIANLINYWSDECLRNTLQECLEGLAHSILVTLDGYSANLPGFVVAPSPHPSDRAYHVGEHENYYPAAPLATCDIAGHLHEFLRSYIRRRVHQS